ncbi:MAG: hypothetical protein LBK82_10535 [Planctomycetaceae bacterium]|jgi:hypothetical protein|nr:hypothetical protein [Planctomycetaceae bacterium]
MTALQNTFNSSTTLYSASAVQSGANTKPQTDSQQIVTNTETSSDIVAISAEGLEAYQKIENAQHNLPQQFIDIESMIAKMPKGGELEVFSAEKHSKHFSAVAWALGIDTEGMSYKEANEAIHINQSTIANLHSQAQATTEKLDEKITSILKTNNIVLDDKETLNLTVNEKGEISIGKGISEDKRTVLEKLLNEDKTLGQDLLFSHAQRQMTNFGIAKVDKNSYQILADSLLQREFGISLSDLEQVRPEETNKVGLSVRSKDGQYDNILETLYEEELETFTFIENALNNRTETTVEKGTAGFEYSYSYKNGVTVEKGVTDQAGMDKMFDRFRNRELLGAVAIYGEDAIDYSVTLDSSGQILDAKINAVKGITDQGALAELNRRWTNHISSIPANSDDYLRDPFLSETTLQQFAFDIQRLYRFNTGASKEQAQNMKMTFGSSIKS